mmetsp:Transcript_11577/g.17606  ORF Transcript_11577/g.17606 Transcript_11577/m.17606 type:complete len:109 (-) Transcript_11577:122-448(-)
MYSGSSGPPNSSFSVARIAMIVVCSLFVVLFLNNVLTKDYNTETKSYLTKIGREDMIPKTTADYMNDVKKRRETFDDLMANVTSLQEEVTKLKAEVQMLRKDVNTKEV